MNARQLYANLHKLMPMDKGFTAFERFMLVQCFIPYLVEGCSFLSVLQPPFRFLSHLRFTLPFLSFYGDKIM